MLAAGAASCAVAVVWYLRKAPMQLCFCDVWDESSCPAQACLHQARARPVALDDSRGEATVTVTTPVSPGLYFDILSFFGKEDKQKRNENDDGEDADVGRFLGLRNGAVLQGLAKEQLKQILKDMIKCQAFVRFEVLY